MAKVGDFGLVRIKSAARRSHSSSCKDDVGTVQYMAPELMRLGGGKLAGERSDVYSYSIVLWELLCQLPVFDGEPAIKVAAHC